MFNKTIGMIAGVLILIGIVVSGSALAKEKLSPGDTPPPLLGVNIEGQAIETTQYAGKVLVVTFWASWCGPCKKELPILEGIQRVGGKDRIQVVAINMEDRDQFRRLSKHLSSLTLMMAHDYRKQASEAYGVHGIPHLVIIGRDGKVITVHRGYGEESVDAIVSEINAALAACDVGSAGKGCSKASG